MRNLECIYHLKKWFLFWSLYFLSFSHFMCPCILSCCLDLLPEASIIFIICSFFFHLFYASFSPSSNILRRNIKTYLHWHTLIFQHFEFFHCNDAFVEHSNSLKSSNFFFSLILGFLRIFSFVEPLNYDMPW